MQGITGAPRILVTGATGQLGQELQALAGSWPEARWTFAGREQLDFSQPETLVDFFATREFDLVINAAAYTAVDKAESEPQLAEQVNHLAVAELAQLLTAQDACLLHISTDYVFDGQKDQPYRETDVCAPQSVYGHSKWRGEQAVIASGVRGAIIRTSWVYSRFGHNFVKTMQRLGKERDQLRVVSDQIGSPTYAQDLAAALIHIARDPQLQSLHGEIYHYSNQGQTSWYEFAKAIFEESGSSCQVEPIATHEYPTAARRPAFSLLDTQKIRTHFALDIPHWRDSLARCLN